MDDFFTEFIVAMMKASRFVIPAGVFFLILVGDPVFIAFGLLIYTLCGLTVTAMRSMKLGSLTTRLILETIVFWPLVMKIDD